jgi:hypothetical protein
LADPNVPLWITEGVKKGDSLASQGECVIDLIGIWNWRAKNTFGGITVSSGFDSIALNSRLVYLAPDSDYAINPSVSQAVKRLAEYLKRKKANVSIVLLPMGKDGFKTGVDDFMVNGHTVAELKALAVPAEEAVISNEQEELERNFVYINHRLYLEVRQYDGGYGFAYLDDQGKVKVAADLPLSGQTIKPRSLPTIEGKEIDYLHDMRVSSRRLQAAMKIFRPVFPQRQFKQIYTQLRALIRMLGEVRHYDVFIETLEKYREKLPECEKPSIDLLIVKQNSLRAKKRKILTVYLRQLESSGYKVKFSNFITKGL